MRFPFNFNDSGINENARIKFLYTSPELHQNIEISIDGEKLSVEVLLETVERFMCALGVVIPENVQLGFVEVGEEEEDEEDEGKEDTIKFTLDDDEDEEEEEDK